MLNSTENLINNLPEPIRKVIDAIYEDVHYGEQCNNKDLYFALIDLKKWLDEPTYGDSIIKKFFKMMRTNDANRGKIKPSKKTRVLKVPKYELSKKA